MIAVIFEVWPAHGRTDDYLARAAALRADLDAIDGFVSVERFQSLSDPNKLLSLSIWRDEDAVQGLAQPSKTPREPGGGESGDFCRLSAARCARHPRLWHDRSRANARGFAGDARQICGRLI